jgi:RNA polymerase sigma-70 factor (ECF subfamily)
MDTQVVSGLGIASVAKMDTQEALLGAIVGVDRFSGKSTIQTWLLGILKNKIFDHLRSIYSRAESSTDYLDDIFDESGKWKVPPSAWKSDPTMHMQEADFREILKMCLDDLPEHQRTLVVMRAFNDASTNELCNLLSISATNLGVLLHRSRHRLRKCLEDHWFMPENTS